MDFADDFVVDDLLTFGYFLEGEVAANIFRFESHARIFMFHRIWCAWIIKRWLLISPSLVCLISSGFVRILLSCELAWLEFALLVIFDFWLGLKFPCLFLFLFFFSFVFVYCGRRAISFIVFFLADAFPFLFLFCTVFFVSCGRLSVSFLVLYCLIRFNGTWYRMFVCFWFNSCILMWSRTKSYGQLTGYIT